MNQQFKITEGTSAFLKSLRDEHHLTQAEMAARLEFNYTSYNLLEKGHRFLTLLMVWKIATEFSLTPGEVINGIYGADPSVEKGKLEKLQELLNAALEENSVLKDKLIKILEGNS